mgnify:CR=1 FL=1
MIIQFDEVLKDYSDNGLGLVKKHLAEYMSCFYMNLDEMGAENLLEKICDYVMVFESKNNKKDSSIPDIYTGELMPVMSKIVKAPKKDEIPCQAYRYLKRAEEITGRIKKKSSNNLLEDLEDFTKIFLCIYDKYLKDKKEKVENIDFKVRGIGFEYIKTDMIKEKRFKFLQPKNKTEDETIYNVLKINDKNNIYNARNFAVMIMTLMYIRLVDLEG